MPRVPCAQAVGPSNLAPQPGPPMFHRHATGTFHSSTRAGSSLPTAPLRRPPRLTLGRPAVRVEGLYTALIRQARGPSHESALRIPSCVCVVCVCVCVCVCECVCGRP